MKTLIKNLINKYIGKIEYVVTIINVDGEGKQFSFHKLKDVDIFVISTNNERYWFVQKIEKFRRCSFIYDKLVLHSPLHFHLDDETEMHKCKMKNGDNHDFSFIKKHESLQNIERVSSKNIKTS